MFGILGLSNGAGIF